MKPLDRSLALGALLTLAACQQAAVATVESVTGTVMSSADGAEDGSPVKAGTALVDGAWLVAGADSSANVKLAAGMAEMGPDSVIVVGGMDKPIRLQAGPVTVKGEGLTVQLGEKGGQAKLTGAAMISRSEGGKLDIEVKKGSLDLPNGGGKAEVGEWTFEGGKLASAVEPEPEPMEEEAPPPPEPFAMVDEGTTSVEWGKAAEVSGPETGTSVEVMLPAKCPKGKILVMDGKKPKVEGPDASSLKVHLPVGKHTLVAKCRRKARMTLTVNQGE